MARAATTARRRRWSVVALASLLLVLVVDAAEARAGRTRPGGGGGTASRPQQASGRATYGHSGGHHGHHGHYGSYGYYGHYGPYYYAYPYFGLGWPYWGWYAGGPHVVVASAGYGSTPGAVETVIKPGKAEVRVDGQFVGQARDFNGRWDRLWIEPGGHVLEFSKAGYKTLRQFVKVRPGGYLRIEDRLGKGEGLDPRSTDRPPPAQRVVRSEMGEAETPRVATAGPSGVLKRGLLRLEVHPPDAAVYLDGEFLARGDELDRLHGAIPVAQGIHAIEVVRPGYVGRSVEVEVRGDEPTRFSVELDRQEK